ncbi:uncharacterized protein METZ01_LOCUS491954 [marine metagenome]|uniref:Uncharacterized protein n=1 Tax=marine metagenome TaxID=408172 RepID=A0A383D478_9ZZZZ
MELGMSGNGRMELGMVKEHSLLMKEPSIMENS